VFTSARGRFDKIHGGLHLLECEAVRLLGVLATHVITGMSSNASRQTDLDILAAALDPNTPKGARRVFLLQHMFQAMANQSFMRKIERTTEDPEDITTVIDDACSVVDDPEVLASALTLADDTDVGDGSEENYELTSQAVVPVEKKVMESSEKDGIWSPSSEVATLLLQCNPCVIDAMMNALLLT
jgi:hypothetical protein